MSAPRILLVDNDPAWLRSEQQYLATLGYDAVTAENERAAEDAFAASEFDLVVLDLILEQKDGGIVLAHHFKKARPELPILMISDLTSETGMVFNLASRGEKRWIQVDRILPKPLRLDRLAFEAELLLGARSLGAATPHHAHEDQLEI
jgi:DNA-binding response OmpR family regulator